MFDYIYKREVPNFGEFFIMNMISSFHPYIVSTGRYVPEKVVLNQDLKQFPARVVELIEQKTGVKARRYANENEYTSDLAIKASKVCLERAGISPTELEGIILATSSPDRIQPATATRVQDKIGAPQAFAFDVNAVCSGGIYAISCAEAFIRSGKYRKILVVASEIYSRILNPADFSTLPYFGDGAGALILDRNEKDVKTGILESILHADGTGSEVIHIPAGGTMKPGWAVEEKQEFYFRMNGRAVYSFAVQRGSEAILQCLQHTGFSMDQINCIIAHQANENVLKEIASRIDCPYDKFFVNLQDYGNTAGASILIALDEALENKRIKQGDLIILVAFGGGLTWGSVMIRL